MIFETFRRTMVDSTKTRQEKFSKNQIEARISHNLDENKGDLEITHPHNVLKFKLKMILQSVVQISIKHNWTPFNRFFIK